MHRQLRKRLADAEGASEYVVALTLDVRGFSAYSQTVESVEAGVYLKRIYLAILKDYIPEPSFFKLTGDGMLVIYRFRDVPDSFDDIATQVVAASLRLIADFSRLAAEDPYITAPVPTDIGIGIARGPGTRIFSGRTILDYSGRVLNLSSRLMDYARPKGIVMEAQFAVPNLPIAARERFEDAQVYVRGVSEQHPLHVLFLKDATEIQPSALRPIAPPKWMHHEWVYSLRDLKSLQFPVTRFELPLHPSDPSKVIVTFAAPDRARRSVNPDFLVIATVTDFRVTDEGGVPIVEVPTAHIVQSAESDGVRPMDEIRIMVKYPPADRQIGRAHV